MDFLLIKMYKVFWTIGIIARKWS